MQEITIAQLPPTLGVIELAQLLHLSEKTVRADLSRAPETLPPPMRRRNQQRSNLVWVTSEVLAWMQDRTAHRTSPPLKKRGAPTKAERVRRQQVAGGQS